MCALFRFLFSIEKGKNAFRAVIEWHFTLAIMVFYKAGAIQYTSIDLKTHSVSHANAVNLRQLNIMSICSSALTAVLVLGPFFCS